MPWDLPRPERALSRVRPWLHSTGVRQSPDTPEALQPTDVMETTVPKLEYFGLVKSKPSCHYCSPWFFTQCIQKCPPPHLPCTLPTMLPPPGEYHLWPASPTLSLSPHHGVYQSTEYRLEFSQCISSQIPPALRCMGLYYITIYFTLLFIFPLPS